MPPPRPLVTVTSQPYWDALAVGRIDLQRCGACNAWVFYPRVICPQCGSGDLAWQTVSGRATLYTFTVAEVPVSPDFADLPPQILAVVELEEGVRVASTLVGVAPDDVRIGMMLAPVYDRETFPGLTALRFRPA